MGICLFVIVVISKITFQHDVLSLDLLKVVPVVPVITCFIGKPCLLCQTKRVRMNAVAYFFSKSDFAFERLFAG